MSSAWWTAFGSALRHGARRLRTIALGPDGPELVGFWGDDHLEAHERGALYANQLFEIAQRLRDTANAIAESGQ